MNYERQIKIWKTTVPTATFIVGTLAIHVLYSDQFYSRGCKFMLC